MKKEAKIQPISNSASNATSELRMITFGGRLPSNGSESSFIRNHASDNREDNTVSYLVLNIFDDIAHIFAKIWNYRDLEPQCPE